MDLLNALLAFSISMLIFSTMSLVIVEVLHRFNRTREKYFAEMIDVFFDELIWTKLRDGKSDTEESLKEKRIMAKDFLAIMTSVSGLVKLDIELAADDEQLASEKRQSASNRQLKGTVEPKLAAKKAQVIKQISTKSSVGVIKPKTTERLTTIEFAQRLARTQAGQLLLTKGTQKAKAIVLDLASQLNAISCGATSDFKQRSRTLALIASAFIAVALNIDAIHLFKDLTSNKQLTAELIKQAPEAVKAYEEQQKIMQQLKQELDGESQQAKDAFSELKQNIQTSQQRITQDALSLSELGVPIGSHYFPWCKPLTNEPSATSLIYADSRCESHLDVASLTSKKGWVVIGIYCTWIGGVLLSIILIGQGSPFWFQMFQKLSMALQLLKTFSLGGSKKTSPDSKPVAEDAYSPERAVEVYFQTISAQPNQQVFDEY